MSEPVRVVFEDERLLAVSKPAGRLVIPGRGKEEGEALNVELERSRGGKIFVVHRLDREASGLVVFAKDAATHARLCGLFESRRVQKKYLAAVLGRVEKPGSVDKPLREFGSGRMGVSEKGKESLTHYEVKEAYANASLLDVRLVTGRRHQIRVHLHSIGHPILGDPLYGALRPVGGAPRLLLHAAELFFEGEPWPLLSGAPGPDFEEALARFK